MLNCYGDIAQALETARSGLTEADERVLLGAEAVNAQRAALPTYAKADDLDR